MFDRFSDNSKKVMALARAASAELRAGIVDVEHVFLGLLQQTEGSAARLLRHFGIEPTLLRAELLQHLSLGSAEPTAQPPFTPETKVVLEFTVEEAQRLGVRHIGTEHLLLAIVREGESLPARILRTAGITIEALRATAIAWQPASMRQHRRLLLISNSTMHGGGYLEHCAELLGEFLGKKKTVLFVPFALADHDAYAAKARVAFVKMGHDLKSVHASPDMRKAVLDTDAVFIGGGNTFRLLRALYHYRLMDVIVERAFAGTPYIGSSAGTNVATPSIRTTNDMPIVQPPSFAALHLVPFQINPHYLDPDPASKHMGETREERLRQFHEENETPVLGLREGCMVLVEGDEASLRGTTNARLFRREAPPQELAPAADLSFLM
ncbi:MAG: dipeptidase PepE [Planctomycetes bacterium]|nr:dipeptidase PepE [Planctomycetota bacterium]MCB9886570.1 dipeptidase PepE [Planctomycetota bacterium]